ncbi:MAG: hypothetical protein JOZ51_17000 [Chloroflexi bacterium]|nr:hypothetical protein [Chloroflexota bacterium]
MNQTRALPQVLQVLDDGLRLYRRNLPGFLLVSTAVLVVIALLVLLCTTIVRTQLGTGVGWTLMLIFLLLLVLYPLTLYTFAALSRAADAALNDRPITLAAALRIGPARGCGMIIFNLLFGFIASVFAGIMSVVVSCPMFYFSLLGGALLSTVSNIVGASAGVFIGVISQISTLWSLISFGGWLASIVYALQAFALEQRPWGSAAGRSVDLLTARFGRSLLMFMGAGAIFGTLSLSFIGTLIATLLLIQDRLNLTIPPFASDAVTIALVVGTLVVLLPPLSIWMAMFHRQVALEQDGDELARRVAAWHCTVTA